MEVNKSNAGIGIGRMKEWLLSSKEARLDNNMAYSSMLLLYIQKLEETGASPQIMKSELDMLGLKIGEKKLENVVNYFSKNIGNISIHTN